MTNLTALTPQAIANKRQLAAIMQAGDALPSVASAPLGKLQIVATRGQTPNAQQVGNTNATRYDGRRLHYVGKSAVSQLKLGFAGFYLNGSAGEALIGNDLGIEASIELASPVTYKRLFAQGVAAGVIANGNPLLLLEPSIGYDIPAGGSFFSRISQTIASSTLFYGFCSQGYSGGDGSTGVVSNASTSQVATTGAMTVPGGGGNVNGVPPYLILGVPASAMPSVIVLGDSIANGTGDTFDAYGDCGYVTRGLNSVNGYPVPWLQQTVGSETLANNQLALGAFRRCAWPYATHLINQLLVNDVIGGTSLATIQTYLTEIWTSAKRTIGPYGKPMKVAQCLSTPHTTSTDSWATAANQTFAAGFAVGGIRDQANAWIKTQVGNGLLDAYIDPNPYCEDQANPGKWVSNGTANYATTDGTHPTQAIHILMAQAVNAWALTIAP